MTFMRRPPKKKPKSPAPPRPSAPIVNVTVEATMGSVSFGDGAKPTIALVNKANADLGVGWEALVKSLAHYANNQVGAIWGTPCDLITADEIPAGAWGLVFTDTADVADALGYHDLTPAGLPLSHVFVETALQAGEKPSVTAAHELAEMLVDPDIALAAQAPDGNFWAYEACDPVQEESYDIDGVWVSNWLYPSFFEAFRAGRGNTEKFDFMGTLKDPFTLRPGGYMPIYDVKTGEWTQIFGSKEREARWAAGPRQRFSRRISPRKTSTRGA
jgi:hypothetical protein